MGILGDSGISRWSTKGQQISIRWVRFRLASSVSWMIIFSISFESSGAVRGIFPEISEQPLGNAVVPVLRCPLSQPSTYSADFPDGFLSRAFLLA